MKRALLIVLLSMFSMSIAVLGQPRTMEKPADDSQIKPAPNSVETKYQGGMIGFAEKEQGSIRFDDINERLVFFNKLNEEQFSINYAAMVMIYPSSNKVQSGTGRTISMAPLPGASIVGSLLKKKKNYLVIQYMDADVDVQGATNFLIDTNDLLLSVVKTLGEKAEMTKRGDSYIRPRKRPVDDN